MPSPRWRTVWRDAWQHKARPLLVVAAIAVGILGAGAVLDTWSLLRQVTDGAYRVSHPASATLRSERLDAALVARVRAMPEIADARAHRTTIASAQVEGSWRTAVLLTVDDFTENRIGVVAPELGAWPPGDGGIVVERSSVDFARTGVGSTLLVQVGTGEPLALPVSGVARDVGLAPGWMEHVVYGFVSRATLARLGASPALDELQIVVAHDRDDREAVRRAAYAVKRVVEASGRRVANVDVPVPGRHVHAAQMDSLLFTQEAFGLLALLLSGLLVVNLVTAMLAGQVREIGVMKAVGATSAQIGGMYLVLALLLGLVASALAVPAAAILGRAYARFTADLLNFSIAGTTLSLRVVAVQLLVGALLPVAAAAMPVLRGCRVTVGAALRDFGIRDGGPRAGHELMARLGIRRPLLLSLRNAFRRRQRMALTLATLAAGGAIYLGAINLRAAVAGSVDLLFATQRFDLALRLARPYPPQQLERLAARVPGVARAEAWAGACAALERADGSLGNAFPLTAPPVRTRLLVPRPERGRWLRPGDDHALVVNRRLLEEEPSLAPGREATLVVEGRRSRWRVVGTVDSGPTAGAYVARESLLPTVGGSRSVMVAATHAGAASRLDLLQRLRAAATDAGLEVQSGVLMAQQRKVIEDHVLMVASFLGVMGWLTIAVGGLGLASTMSLSVLERTREIGVLRAIGARHGAILALVHVEALVVAVLGWLLAVPLSVPMSVALGNAFGRIMFRVPVILTPQPEGVLRWLLVAVVVALLAAAWPAWRATRVTTAAALAYE